MLSDLTERPDDKRWGGTMRGGRLGNLFFVYLLRHGGLALAPFFVFWVALYFLLAAPSARNASFELAKRLGRGGSMLRRLLFAFRHFFMFGRLFVDRMAIVGGNAALFQIEFHGEENISDALKQGRGVVLVTAHLGNWEAMGHLLTRLDAPVTLVMYDGVQPAMKKTMEELSKGRSFRVLYTDGSPASAAAILAALSRGDIVGMMGDRVLAGQAVAVPFLGREALFPIGPWIVAATARAPVVHVFSVREARRRYAFHGFPAATLHFSDRESRQADLERWATGFAQRVEEFVRVFPEQWGNFFPFWSQAKAEDAVS